MSSLPIKSDLSTLTQVVGSYLNKDQSEEFDINPNASFQGKIPLPPQGTRISYQRKPIPPSQKIPPSSEKLENIPNIPVDKSQEKSTLRVPVKKSSPEREEVPKVSVRTITKKPETSVRTITKKPVASPEREEVPKTSVRTITKKPVASPEREEEVPKTSVRTITKKPVASPEREEVPKVSVRSVTKKPVASPEREEEVPKASVRTITKKPVTVQPARTVGQETRKVDKRKIRLGETETLPTVSYEKKITPNTSRYVSSKIIEPVLTPELVDQIVIPDFETERARVPQSPPSTAEKTTTKYTQTQTPQTPQKNAITTAKDINIEKLTGRKVSNADVRSGVYYSLEQMRKIAKDLGITKISGFKRPDLDIVIRQKMKELGVLD